MVTTSTAPAAHYTLPSPRISLVRIGGPLWLVGWLAGLYGSVAALGTGHTGHGALDVFLFVWLLLWLGTGTFVFGLVAWSYLGREYITIGPDVLSVQRRVLLPGPVRQYVLADVENVRFREMPTDFFGANSRWSLLGVGRGKVRFDYRGETFSFGLGLPDAEARDLASDLSSRT